MAHRPLIVLALVLAATAGGCTLDAPVVSIAPPPPSASSSAAPPFAAPPGAQPSTAPSTTPAAAPAPSAAPAPVAAIPATDPKVLGPDGYGMLELGISRADALARGLITPADPAAGDPAGCTLHYLAARPGPVRVAVYASPQSGVVRIGSAPDWHTPEHIGVGSTLAQVKAAYPNLVQQVNGSDTTVPGNPGAVYRFMFDQRGTVTDLALELRGQECTN